VTLDPAKKKNRMCKTKRAQAALRTTADGFHHKRGRSRSCFSIDVLLTGGGLFEGDSGDGHGVSEKKN